MSKRPKVEFFFDCSSPWTYMAFHNIQPMAADLGIGVTWRPFLVGGVFNAVNDSVYQNRADPVPAKESYLAKDIADWARYSGITIVWPPSVFPVRSVDAMRACLAAQDRERLVPFATAVFEAYWTHDRDISDWAVLADCCQTAGLAADDIREAIVTPAIKDKLRANTDEAVKRGAFGSPTIFVNETDMYFGNDRLVLVRRALEQALAP